MACAQTVEQTKSTVASDESIQVKGLQDVFRGR